MPSFTIVQQLEMEVDMEVAGKEAEHQQQQKTTKLTLRNSPLVQHILLTQKRKEYGIFNDKNRKYL